MRTVDRVAGITAQVVVTLLYGMFIALFFTYDSNLKLDVLAGDYGYPVVYLLFSVLSLALYFAVGFKNPGYIQANASEIGLMLSDQPDRAVAVQLDDVDDDMDAEDGVGGRERHCRVCHIDQGIRTKHCRKCDRCVGRFDHHCFFINNCVGEGNAALFWWYLLFQSLCGLWTIKQVVSCMTEQGSAAEWFRVNALPLVALIAIIGFAMVATGLLVLHTYLMITAQTTWEMMARKKITYLRALPSWAFPFSQGCFRNIGVFCCRLPGLSGKWVLPAEITDAHRVSLCASRHHNCF